MFRHFFRDRVFFHQFFRILLPIAGNNLIMVGVAMADTIMVGSLGDLQLSSVALANQFGFVLQLMLFGLAGGSNVLIAQYWGRRDIQTIRKIMTLMYRFLAGSVLVFAIPAVFFPRHVMMIFSADAEVIATGAGYLRIVGMGYAFQCFASATMMVLRSVGTVNIALAVYSASLVSNVFFNWVFIFGKLGAPAMGVRGAAVATLISRVLEITLVAIYLFRYEQAVRYRLRMFLEKKLGVLRSFVQNAFPIWINELLWSMGSSAIAVIIGRMGTEFTAAHSVNSVLMQLVNVAIFGAGNASAVIIGNSVGAGKYRLARLRAAKLAVISIVFGLCAMGMMLLLRRPMLALYNISDLAKTYASSFMTVYAVIALFQSFSIVALMGVLRGGGDGRFVALVDVLAIWLFAIPLGFLSGHVWGWPAAAVMLALRSDEVIKTLIVLPRLLSGKWVNDVTRK